MIFLFFLFLNYKILNLYSNSKLPKTIYKQVFNKNNNNYKLIIKNNIYNSINKLFNLFISIIR